MPRTGRGGQRQGSPGTPYPNRSDLTTPRVAPDQPYGNAAEQLASMRTVPIAAPPSGPTAPAAGGPPAQGAPSAAPAPGQGAPNAQALMALLASEPQLAGRSGGLFRPTERPGEPVTHGLPTGAGAGPEALSGIGALANAGTQEQSTLGNMLQGLASQPGASSSVQQLARLAMGGQS